MKDIDTATEITVALAKALIEEMQALNVRWRQAFMRIEADGFSVKVKGSYVLAEETQLFDVFKHRPMIRLFTEKARDLQDATSNRNCFYCVALLIVDPSFNYEIKYEYTDRSRWEISKLRGSSGYPAGLETT